MKFSSKVALMCGVLALAACSNNRFDDAPVPSDQETGAVTGFDQSQLDSQPLPDSPEYFSQVVGDRVLFVVDQSTLTAEAKATLDTQAQWLMTNNDYLAVIEGHADEQGTREYNLALGARRANAVMEYLVSKGVPSSRLKFVSYGKERPAEVCSNEACYAKNRRAVTIISAGSLS